MLPSPLDLTYFLEAANTLSLSRAARKLNVSQPSLTLAIKRLERLLNQCLFIRHKQGVTLTRAGTELFKNTHELMENWALIKLKVCQMHQEIRGRVTIGCNSTLAVLLSGFLSELLTQYPSLEINLEHALTEKLIKEIICGHIDVGIVINPSHHSNIVLTKVADIEFAFWSSIKIQAPLDLSTNDTTIICDPNLPITQFLVSKLREKSSKNLRMISSNQFEVIAALIENGCGIGILPSCWAEKIFANKLKKIKSIPSCTNPMYLAHNYQNKEVAVIQIIRKALKNLAHAKLISISS